MSGFPTEAECRLLQELQRAVTVGHWVDAPTLQLIRDHVASENARIIASTSTMLAALEAITEQLERVGDSRKDAPFIDAARTAIAKARA